MSEHIYTFINPISKKHVAKALHILRNNGVICYPLEQNWAFGCLANSSKGIDKIRKLKPTHPKSRPFSLICSDISMASKYGIIENYHYRVLKKAWPGPYTILLKSIKNISKELKDKRKIVGIRIPDSPLVIELINSLEIPLATTTVPEKAPDLPYKMGFEIFDDFGHGIDLCLDLGDELTGLESTVVDFTEDGPNIIREGFGDPAIFQ